MPYENVKYCVYCYLHFSIENMYSRISSDIIAQFFISVKLYTNLDILAPDKQVPVTPYQLHKGNLIFEARDKVVRIHGSKYIYQLIYGFM